MFVLMQYKAVATLTNVRAHCVDALVLTAAVVLAALILVCERYTCNTSLMWKTAKRRSVMCGEGSSRGKKWKDETLRKGRRVFGNAKKVIRKGERARKQEKGRNGETEISEED